MREGHSMSTRRKAGGTLFITLAARGIGFLVPVLILRETDHQVAGLAFLTIQLAYFASQPVAGGPAIAAIAPLAASQSRQASIEHFQAMVVLSLQALCLSMGLAACLGLLTATTSWGVCVITLGVCAEAVYFQLCNAESAYIRAALARMSSNILQVLSVGILIASGHGSLTAILLAYGVALLATAIAMWFLFRGFSFARLSPWRPITRAIATLRRSSYLTFGASLAYSALIVADTTALSFFGRSSLAEYGAAKTLASLPLLVGITLTVIVIPETAKTRPSLHGRQLKRLVQLGFSGMFALLALTTLGGSLLITTIYSGRYDGAKLILAILVVGTASLSFHSLLQGWCLGINRPRLPFISLVTGATTTIVLALLLNLITSLKATIACSLAFSGGGILAVFILLAMVQLYSPSEPSTPLPQQA